MPDAFGNALGYSLAEGSGQGSGNAGAGEQLETLSQKQAATERVYLASADGVPNDAGGLRVWGMLPQRPEPVVESSVVTSAWTGADADDAGYFGGGDDAYVMDEARTRFQLDEGAKTARIVNGQIAEAKMMANARAAQDVTVQNQREPNRTASLIGQDAQAPVNNVAVDAGNALYKSETGAAYGNRQLSIRERTQTNDPVWSSNVGRGFRGEPLSVMATHDEREAAKLGGLLRLGFDLTPVGAVYNYGENTIAGRPFSALASIAPYAIPGAALVVANTERALMRSVDGIVTNKTPLAYDVSKWGEYGLPSDGVFSRTLTAEQYRAYKAGREFNFAGKAWPEGGYPNGMGFVGAAEDARRLTTVSGYREGLKLGYDPKYVIEFQLRDLAGLQNAVRAPYAEFVPGGRTGAGLREWNLPGISSNDIINSTVRVLK